MPGPGVELIGEEEIAEVMEVLTNRSLSRYGQDDDPRFGAKVRRVEQEIAGSTAVGRAACGCHSSGSASVRATR